MSIHQGPVVFEMPFLGIKDRVNPFNPFQFVPVEKVQDHEFRKIISCTIGRGN